MSYDDWPPLSKFALWLSLVTAGAGVVAEAIDEPLRASTRGLIVSERNQLVALGNSALDQFCALFGAPALLHLIRAQTQTTLDQMVNPALEVPPTTPEQYLAVVNREQAELNRIDNEVSGPPGQWIPPGCGTRPGAIAAAVQRVDAALQTEEDRTVRTLETGRTVRTGKDLEYVITRDLMAPYLERWATANHGGPVPSADTRKWPTGASRPARAPGARASVTGPVTGGYLSNRGLEFTSGRGLATRHYQYFPTQVAPQNVRTSGHRAPGAPRATAPLG